MASEWHSAVAKNAKFKLTAALSTIGFWITAWLIFAVTGTILIALIVAFVGGACSYELARYFDAHSGKLDDLLGSTIFPLLAFYLAYRWYQSGSPSELLASATFGGFALNEIRHIVLRTSGHERPK